MAEVDVEGLKRLKAAADELEGSALAGDIDAARWLQATSDLAHDLYRQRDAILAALEQANTAYQRGMEDQVVADNHSWEAGERELAAMTAERDRLQDIIRAYAGPGGMTPEDVAAALEQGEDYRLRLKTANDAYIKITTDLDAQIARWQRALQPSGERGTGRGPVPRMRGRTASPACRPGGPRWLTSPSSSKATAFGWPTVGSSTSRGGRTRYVGGASRTIRTQRLAWPASSVGAVGTPPC